jgi:hypothetical protein
MNLFRLICLLFICCSLGTARQSPAIPITHPEEIGGRWETATSSGIEGIGFEIVSLSKGSLGSKDEHFIQQYVNVRVYTREGGKEKWGYFAATYRHKPKTDPLPDPTSFEVFDGRHLRIHFTDTTDIKPFDLDIVFLPSETKWIGTWAHEGKAERVVLTRPEAGSGLKQNKFVGEWIGDPGPESPNSFASTVLEIRQSCDGVVSASFDVISSWRNARNDVIHDERRDGRQLNVESISDDSIVLSTHSSTAPTFQFRGSLSSDAQILTGNWGTIGGGGELDAAKQFRRAPFGISREQPAHRD